MSRAIRNNHTLVRTGAGLLLALVTAGFPGFSRHHPDPPTSPHPLPSIEHVYPQTCDQRGGTIVLYGHNLKSARDYTLSARAGGKLLRPRILDWNTHRIIAVIPRHAALVPGSRLQLGLSRRGRSRWLGSPVALTVCRGMPDTARTPPPGIPAGYVPRQLLVLGPGRATSGRLHRYLGNRGFRLLDRRRYPALGLRLSLFRVPGGLPVPVAVQRLRQQYPGYTIDANHRFRLHRLKPSAQHPDNRQQALIGWGPVRPGCGRGIRLGILDTGIDRTHRLLRGRAIISRSFLPPGVAAAPTAHATAITSIWLGRRNGLVPGARVYAAGVFGRLRSDLVTTNTKWLLDGLEWLVRQRVDVINMSFGGPQNRVLAQAIDHARSRGILLVASAGNDGPGAPPAYPAAYRGVVAVTAVDNRLRLYRKANRGHYVDFSAPGVNVPVARPGNRTKVASGTSFAAPYVSAAIALLKQRNPARQAQLLRALRLSSRDLGVRGKDPLFGWGLLQLHNACR